MRFLFLVLSFWVSSVVAQVTSPLRTPIAPDPTPKPFTYPAGFADAIFDLPEKIAGTVFFGENQIELGKTRLSEITKKTRAELHHNSLKEDYLCFSAPIKTTTEEPSSETQIHQNIWFILGDRGQIREVRMEEVPASSLQCPAFSEDNPIPSLAQLTIGMTTEVATQTLSIPPVVENPEDGWKYWFSQQPSMNKSGHTHLNLFAIQEKEGRIVRLISVVEDVAN